jgi:uncharacterized protein
MSDVDVVRGIYTALEHRDFDRLFDLIDPEVVITQDSALPWGGRFVGHDGLAKFALALSDAITSSVAHEAIFVANGEVIQYGRTRGETRATGTPFDIPEVHRWTIQDGKAVAAHFAIDTEAMLAALAGNAT